MQDDKTDGAERSDGTIAPDIGGKLARSRVALIWEQVWPAMWPPLCVLGLFFAAALSGVNASGTEGGVSISIS